MKNSICVTSEIGSITTGDIFITDHEKSRGACFFEQRQPFERPDLIFVEHIWLFGNFNALRESLTAVKRRRKSHFVVNIVCAVAAVVPRYTYNSVLIDR